MINEKYSYKDFTGQTFKKVDVSEFNNTEIIGSCFASETIDTVVFPPDMTGVEFKKCNLNNVVIPEGNTVSDDSANHRIVIQQDGEDWKVDRDQNPIEPISRDVFLKLNWSIDPRNIPAKMV